MMLSTRFIRLSQFSSIKRGAKVQTDTLQKLVFDEQNYSLIYNYRNGEENLKWSIRGCTMFTLMNTFVSVGEHINPLFGGWNGISFGVCASIGAVTMIFLQVFSKRTVSQIKLYKTGDFVEIKYFNAFWTPHYQRVHCSEFAELEQSLFGFHKVELTSIGKIWINLEKNSSLNPYLGYDVLLSVLSGHPVKLDALKSKKKYGNI